MKKVGCFLVFIFVLISKVSFGTEPENIPYKKITTDSILIESTPFCIHGDLGRTRIKNLKTNQILYDLDFYDLPSTVYSSCGNYRVQTDHQLNFYYRDSLLKSYDFDSLFNHKKIDSLIIQDPFVDYKQFTDCFIYNGIFYGLTVPRTLYKIPLTMPKLNEPIITDKFSFDKYDSFIEKTPRSRLIYDSLYEFPEIYIQNTILKDTICHLIQKAISPMSNEKYSISLVLMFNECKPQIICLETHKRRFYLYANKHLLQDESFTLHPHYLEIQKLIDNIDFNCKFMNNDKKWAVSLIIDVN